MCERKGQDADMCPYQMHCPKRCISCGDASTAVCLNPFPKRPEEDAKTPKAWGFSGFHSENPQG